MTHERRPEHDPEFEDAVQGLHRGDFDALAPLFFPDPARPTEPPRIMMWHAAGRFHSDPGAVAEALTCASFLGTALVAQHFLQAGVDPTAGSGTGMDALHWAVNRGQTATVDLLLQWKAPLEVRNMHGTTVLGTAIWSALNEPRLQHMEIIQTLLDAGARRENVKPVASYVEGQLDELQRKRVVRIEAILASRGAA
jgi:ankyrin repeat protein